MIRPLEVVNLPTKPPLIERSGSSWRADPNSNRTVTKKPRPVSVPNGVGGTGRNKSMTHRQARQLNVTNGAIPAARSADEPVAIYRRYADETVALGKKLRRGEFNPGLGAVASRGAPWAVKLC